MVGGRHGGPDGDENDHDIGGGSMVTKVATLVVQGANWRVQSKSRRC